MHTHIASVHAYTGLNQLSQQVLGANTEMQYGVISLSPPLQGRMRMGAVPVQKIVNFDARPDAAETEEAISKFKIVLRRKWDNT